MTGVKRLRFHRSRWLPWLLTVVYAIFGGISFQYFHELAFEALIDIPNRQFWVHLTDGAYVLLTVLLIFLLISRLIYMLREYESAIEQSEERFRGVVESTRDWIWELNARNEYTFVGPNVQTLIGLNPEDVLGKTPFELMPEDDIQSARELLYRISHERQPFRLIELCYTHQDGHQVIVESTGEPIFDSKGVFQGYRGIDRDVTERRLAEKAVERSHDFYRSLFDDLPIPIWRSNSEGRIIYYNHSGEKLLGKTLDEPDFRLGLIDSIDQKAYDDAYRQALLTHQPFTLTYRLRRFDGTFMLVVHVGQPCYDPSGKFVGYIGYFLDIGQVQKAAELYRHAALN